jgi:hypothetical protein
VRLGLDLQLRAHLAELRRDPGRKAAYAGLVLLGLAILYKVSVASQGGWHNLFLFDPWPTHRVTARALVSGSLRVHPGLLNIGHDEQVYNGGTFTNWGYGVPLLRVPFDVLERAFTAHSFFPDRLTFFLYWCGSTVLLWFALYRTWSEHLPKGRRLLPAVLAWAATFAVLVFGTAHVISYRFLIYEETIGYFVVFETYALATYLMALQTRRPAWVAAFGVTAAMGLLIRPTGLIYLGLWGLLLAGRTRDKKVVAWFAGAAAPLVAFWCYTNWVRTGSAFSPGFQNTHPGTDQFAVAHFGNSCSDTMSGFLYATETLAKGLFSRVPDLPPPPGTPCQFFWETRLDMARTVHLPLDRYAALLPTWAAFLVVGSFVQTVIATRARRPERYLPHATFVALFFAFGYAGGFAWRYAGDLLPVLALIGVSVVSDAKLPRRKCGAIWVAAGVGYLAAVALVEDVLPCTDTIEVATFETVEAAEQTRQLELSAPPVTASSRLECGKYLPRELKNDGLGWRPGCTVDTFTNVYLGVPDKGSPYYVLRVHVDHPLLGNLRVQVNGRMYEAHWDGNAYVANVRIRLDRMYSPVTMVTIEWARHTLPPALELLDIELT